MRNRIIIDGTEEELMGVLESVSVALQATQATITVERQAAFKALWVKNFGRNGTLEARYLVNKEGRELLEAMEAGQRQVRFGEVLGKHSDISSTLTWRFVPDWENKTLQESKDGVVWLGGQDPYGMITDEFYDEVMGTSPPDEGTRAVFLNWLRKPENYPVM